MISRKNTKKMKNHIFSSEESLNNNIHKIYLTLALLLGSILAIGMPLFSEPDGVFHFVNASNIAGLTVDVSAYGETAYWWGDQFATQRPSMQEGTHFEKYFKNEVQLMSIEELPRLQEVPSMTSFRYWSAAIPSLGVWVGYHIYPSMGVMIVSARLINMFCLSIAMFFIIKYVKRGKLFFILTTMNPVVMNLFASLSNDGLSVVLVSLMIAFAINTIVDNELTNKKILAMVLLSVIIIFAAKTNFMLIILLLPLLLFVYLSKGRVENYFISKPFWIKLGFIAILSVILIGLSVVFLTRFGGIGTVIYRLLINVFYNFSFSAQSVFTSALTNPLFEMTPMPIWLSAAWLLMLILAALEEEKFVKHPLVSWGSLSVFILNFLGIYITFMVEIGGGRNRELGFIWGLQGRYFTAFIPLLLLFLADKKFKLKVSSFRTISVLSFLLIVGANLLLLFNTLFRILYF